MMALTPETLPRHELIGLTVEVVDATSNAYLGIAGRVVDETTNTLVIASSDGESRVRQVPKSAAVFQFTLPDESAECRKGSGTTSDPAPTGDDVAHVTVDGERLLSRPAERTETHGDTIWESD